MSETTTGYTPTDEDVAFVARAVCLDHTEMDPAEFDDYWRGLNGYTISDYRSWARDVLATIGPIVERERRAAKVEALAPVRALHALDDDHWCLGCDLDYPCPTIRAIDEIERA